MSSPEEARTSETELKFEIAAESVASLAKHPAFDTEAERGYRLAGHDATASIKAEQAALTPTTPAAEAFRLCARSCLTQIVGNAQLLGRVRSPQALHQTRVGLRRMRAVLSTFKPLIEDARFSLVRAEAEWLGGELDQARDLDVFILESLPPDEDGLQEAAVAALARRLLSAQAAAYGRAIAAIDSQRFADFLLEVTAWVEIGDWARREDQAAESLRRTPVAAFGVEALERLHRAVRKRGRGLKRLDPEARHHLRIAAKKLRYAAELFAATFPGHPRRRRRYLEALCDLQDQLGALNDLSVAARVAMAAVGQRGTDAAFAAGLLVGRRRQAEPDRLAKAARAYRRFTGARTYWRPGQA